MTTGTELAHVQTVPRETSALLPTSPEESSADVNLLADARAEARSWSPNTRRAYVAGWKHFISWCIEHRCAGLPARAADVDRYIERLVETEGLTLTTARLRLAAIAAAHRLGGHEDPTSRPLVKATMKRLGREHGKSRKQARGLTKEALAAIKATARIQRIDKGKRQRKETEFQATMRGAVDLALLEVMRDGLLRGSEASVLRWGNLEFHTDGSGRLHVLRSKTDQTAEGTVLYLGPAAVDALLAIRPNEAVIDLGASVFGLSARQISRRIKAETKIAGLGEGFSGHSPRVGMAQDLSAAGAELSELMTAGRWDSPTMPAKYTEAQAAGRGAVARYHRGDLRK